MHLLRQSLWQSLKHARPGMPAEATWEFGHGSLWLKVASWDQQFESEECVGCDVSVALVQRVSRGRRETPGCSTATHLGGEI